MHSHVGLHNFPQLKGDNDVNERSRAATPFARAIDAFNPSDKAIQLNRDEGGVTTSMILPGSSNVIAGEVLYIKHRNTSRVVEMV
jgi:imidazolonepropionase-like amidohydrolase